MRGCGDSTMVVGKSISEHLQPSFHLAIFSGSISVHSSGALLSINRKYTGAPALKSRAHSVECSTHI